MHATWIHSNAPGVSVPVIYVRHVPDPPFRRRSDSRAWASGRLGSSREERKGSFMAYGDKGAVRGQGESVTSLVGHHSTRRADFDNTDSECPGLLFLSVLLLWHTWLLFLCSTGSTTARIGNQASSQRSVRPACRGFCSGPEESDV